MIISLLYVAVGLALLVGGAEGLVRGSSSAAMRMGVSALAVGLTIVAFGTSSPELVVSFQAALNGNTAISLGNVVGSNIANIALILGVASLIRPIKANSEVVRRETPIMLVVSGLFVVLIYDGNLSRIDGAIFVAGIIAYTALTFYLSRKSRSKELESEFEDAVARKTKSPWIDVVFIVGGLALLVAGSDLFVSGAIEIAKLLGVSQMVIGLTIVALGTSLPELATSAVAALKGESDVALGNVIGSNVFNILAVLGITSLVKPMPTAELSTLDLWMMVGTAFVLWLMLGRRYLLDRLEAVILLIGYAVYVYMLVPK